VKQLPLQFDPQELPAELRPLFHMLIERTRMEPEPPPGKRPTLKVQIDEIERKKA
jgi:hypothetical protein